MNLKNLLKHEENVTYELVPDPNSDQAWNVRFKEGLYNETVVKYGAIAVNEVAENISFSFEIISCPDTDLNENDEDLQDFAADVLQHIIAEAIEKGDGSVVLKERSKEEE